ncbi:MAG: serine/threonine-protein kinase [Gemmatimonadetes bacterium]|nr:serine/threonine-protein kinase [Gemmatimonadota bacterium]
MTQLTSAQFQSALSNRYVFDRVLGRGGMGTVYLARDVKHGRQVAIKAMSPEVVAAVGARQFLREIRVTAQLQHPHILQLIDSGEAAGCPYYVMPYIKEGSLRELLDSKKRLSADDALAILSDLAGALEYAHENGVIHCDIKPANILISAGHAVLADFGIARAHRVQWRAWRAVVDSSAGTPEYMSPEQATGDVVDGRSDLYSLACVLYEMLAGEPPFSAESDQAMIAGRFTKPIPRLDEVVRHTIPGLSLAVEKAMALHPRHRFPSIAVFMRAVESEVSSPTASGSRSRRRWSEAFGLMSYRIALRLRRRLRKTVAQSKRGLDAAAAGTSGRGWQHDTLG